MHEEQEVMEGRYNIPLAWTWKPSSRHWRGKNGQWALAFELVGPIKGKKVLDGGCGDGWNSARMKESGALVTGIDYSDRAIQFARAIVPGVSFAVGSLTKLPYSDGEFDVVFSFQVLEHIPPADLHLAVGELRRVLKKDGTLLISVPSTNRKLSKAHFQHFTAESISNVLSPHFFIKSVTGQEKRGLGLWCIERVLENRIWHLPELAERFHRGWYLKIFNRTTSKYGANLFVVAK